MQESRAQRTPKSVHDNNGRPIFVQFVNWCYAEDIRKKLTELHTNNKSKVTVSQMFSKNLKNCRNQSLLRRKEILKESPDLSVFLDFPAKLMGKKRQSREKYKLLEKNSKILKIFNLDQPRISCENMGSCIFGNDIA